MKRHLVLVGLSGLSVCSLFLACDDSSSGGSSGQFTFDSGTPSFDASQPPNDAALANDAPVSTGATVIVTDIFGAGVPNVTVVYNSADGTLVGTKVTDATGRATNTVADGSMITVALGGAFAHQLLTYVGVKSNDVINVVQPTARTVDVTLTANPPNPSVFVQAGNAYCSTTTANGTVPLNLIPPCITGSKFAVLASTVGGNGTVFSYQKDITPAASGSTTVNAMSDWTLAKPFQVDVTGAPSTTAPSIWANVQSIANNQGYTAPRNPLTLNGGTGSHSFNVPSLTWADAYQGAVFYETPVGNSGLVNSQAFAKRAAAVQNVNSQTLDLTPGMLPGLTSLTATNMTEARPIVTWTASASLASADSGVVDLTYAFLGDGGNQEVDHWTFIVPPDALTVQAPQLPAELADWQPNASWGMPDPTIAFFESDLVAGYDAVRKSAGAFGVARVPLTPNGVPQLPTLPADGTIRATFVYNAG